MAEKDFDLVPISTGNLLRDIIRGEGEYEQDLVDEISELIKNGRTCTRSAVRMFAVMFSVMFYGACSCYHVACSRVHLCSPYGH